MFFFHTPRPPYDGEGRLGGNTWYTSLFTQQILVPHVLYCNWNNSIFSPNCEKYKSLHKSFCFYLMLSWWRHATCWRFLANEKSPKNYLTSYFNPNSISVCIRSAKFGRSPWVRSGWVSVLVSHKHLSSGLKRAL